MREIKFKLAITSDWDEGRGTKVSLPIDIRDMHENFYMEFPDETGCDLEDLNDGSTKIIYLQYTGSKDKNGVEVYEGDIIQYNQINYEVKFSDYGKVCLAVNKDGERFLYELASKDTEVLGNIYENRYLL